MRKISPSGAVIMSGEGIAATRKKIEERFSAARDRKRPLPTVCTSSV
jgi:hypothetical protein